MIHPRVSVVMPVYNAERYVAQAVQSILDQTFRDFEFLIVDDGSTDRSLEILKRFAAQDDRIRLISRPNTGYVVALNEMLDLARGEFIARMDADDVCLRRRFEKQTTFLLQNPSIWVLGSSVDIIDDRGQYLRTQELPQTHDTIDQRNLAGDCAVSHPSVMFRKQPMISSLGGYDATMMPSEDLDLWLRVAEQARIANLGEVLLQYRYHANSISRSQQAKQLEKVKSATGAAKKRRGLPQEEPSHNGERPLLNNSGQPDGIVAGWWALNSGQVDTARRHAFASVLRHPASRDSWRLLFCAMRGH